MRRDQILHLAVDQYQVFLENYSLSLVSDEAEYIHHYRVAVKKLNAIKRVVTLGLKEQDQDLLDGGLWSFIQPVYKTGGKVRNLQVILDLLATFVAEPPSDFKQFLYDRLREKRLSHDNIATIIKPLSEKAFFNVFNVLVEMSFNSGFIDLSTVVKGLGERATLLIENNPAGEAWHEARRYFKESAHLIQLAESVGEQLVGADNFFRYREMEQLLGSWHDFFMLNRLVAKYASLMGEQQDALWTAFIQEKTETVLRIEEDICLLVGTFQISKT